MITQNIRMISHEKLIETVLNLKHEGYRLVQMCATNVESEYELTYSFGKEYEFLCIRMMISDDTEIMSISNVYPPAFLYENEMKDLFGLNINLISLDYQGEFYKLGTKTPYKN